MVTQALACIFKQNGHHGFPQARDEMQRLWGTKRLGWLTREMCEGKAEGRDAHGEALAVPSPSKTISFSCQSPWRQAWAGPPHRVRQMWPGEQEQMGGQTDGQLLRAQAQDIRAGCQGSGAGGAQDYLGTVVANDVAHCLGGDEVMKAVIQGQRVALEPEEERRCQLLMRGPQDPTKVCRFPSEGLIL